MFSVWTFLCYSAFLFPLDTSSGHIQQLVQGNIARVCEFPSIVQLLVRDESLPEEEPDTFCAASILSPTQLLTAAHCLEEDSLNITVKFGAVDQTGSHVLVTNVTTFVTHENYTRNNMIIFNDIAIVRLQKPLPFSKCVKAAPMATNTDSFDNVTCEVIGWGRTAPDGPISKDLRKAKLPSIPFDTCVDQSKMNILPGFICAGRFLPGGTHTCQGDSGGPLYCPNSKGDMVLAGVTSFGSDCYHDVSVFSSVAYHSHWIRDHLGYRVNSEDMN